MASITDRLKSAWNAFNGRDQTEHMLMSGWGLVTVLTDQEYSTLLTDQ